MMSMPLSLDWNVEGLRASMQPSLPGIEVEVVASTGSTSTALLEALRAIEQADDEAGLAIRRRSIESRAFQRRAPDRAPRLLVAEHQTAGRGRLGRAWHAAVGASLTFSLAVPIQRVDLSGLSLAIGVAVAEAIAPGPAGRLAIKWPNDLWLLSTDGIEGARKLGGILIETVSAAGQRWAVIGIGLNVRPVEAPGATTGVAALTELDPACTAPLALERIAGPLAGALATFEREGFAAFAARFAERDLLQGRPVTTTAPDIPEGVARGVDASGALRIDTAAGPRALHGGEVSVRPVANPA